MEKVHQLLGEILRMIGDNVRSDLNVDGVLTFRVSEYLGCLQLKH